MKRGNTLPTISGEIVTTSTTAGRGQIRTTRGGADGYYVGTTATGREWFAYTREDFAEACADFDAIGGAL